MTVHESFSLHTFNTLKIPVQCDYFAAPTSLEECRELLSDSKFNAMKKFVLGGGANILFLHDYHGLVIHPVLKGITIVEETDDSVLLESASGELWHDLVTYAVEHNFGGIENLALIPGAVGAAPIQNIAAYGQNLSDTFESLTAVEIATGEVTEFTKEMCRFDYRGSIFKNEYSNKYLITSICLRLKKNPSINTEYWSKKHGSVGQELERLGNPPYTITSVYDAVVSLRTKKFPDMDQFGTAGSFFKNPLVSKAKLDELLQKMPSLQYYPAEELRYTITEHTNADTAEYYKVAAGGILDEGMRYAGKWGGNVGLYEKHALILVTNGKATGEEVQEFASKIQNDFYSYCGVELETEILYVK